MKEQSFIDALLVVFDGVQSFMLPDQWPQYEIQHIVADVLGGSCLNASSDSYSVNVGTLVERLCRLSVFYFSFRYGRQQWSPIYETFSQFEARTKSQFAVAETPDIQVDKELLTDWLISLMKSENFHVH